jgi:hypothetical protein
MPPEAWAAANDGSSNATRTARQTVADFCIWVLLAYGGIGQPL